MATNNITFQLDHLSQNRGPMLRSVAITISTLTTVVVLLRFCARKSIGAKIMADDYTILVAMVAIWGITGGYLAAINHGFGQHTASIIMHPEDIEPALKAAFFSEVIYTLAMSSVKLSILLLYRRIFSTGRFWILNTIMMAFVCLTFVSGTLTTILQCVPLARHWNLQTPGHCSNFRASTVSGAVVSLVGDIVILIMPLPMIWKLHVSRGRKLLLSAIFFLGTFGCVASMIRLHYSIIFDYDTDSYSVVPFATWSLVEPCIATICSCTVVLRPLVMTYIVEPISTYRTSLSNGSQARIWGSNRNTTSASSSSPSRHWAPNFRQGPWSNQSSSSTKDNAVTEVYEIRPYKQGDGDDSVSSPPPTSISSPPPARTRQSRLWRAFVPHKDSRYVNATTIDHDISTTFEEEHGSGAQVGDARIRIRNDVEWGSIHSPPKR